jgi:hypothetical protein
LKKVLKIAGIILFLLAALLVTLSYQAERILISLIQASSTENVQVKIGRLIVDPTTSSLQVRNAMVEIKNPDNQNHQRITLNYAMLDVVSLWDFFTGGALIIERFYCEEGELFMAAYPRANAPRSSFTLAGIVKQVQQNAIRFQIQDIQFNDINLVLQKDSTKDPIHIRHFHLHAQDLYLSADSLRKRKPWIEFYLPGQTLKFPNGTSLAFDSLFFSNTDNSIQLNVLAFDMPRQTNGNTYTIRSERARISQFNFENLLTHNRISMDSVYLGKSDFSIGLTIETSDDQQTRKSNSSLVIPGIDINTVFIHDLKASLNIRNGTSENNFDIEKAYLLVHDFRYQPDSIKPAYTSGFDLIITQYKSFVGQNLSRMQFDTVHIQKNELALRNFELFSDQQKEPQLHTATFTLRNVNWVELLANRKLVADEAQVLRPTVRAHIQRKVKAEQSPVNYHSLLATLREFMEVEKITLVDATAFIHLDEARQKLVLMGMYTTISVDAMLGSTSLNEAVNAVQQLSFENLSIASTELNGYIRDFRFRDGKSRAGEVSLVQKNKLNARANNLFIGKVNWQSNDSSFSIEGLGWGNLNVEATIPGKDTASVKHTPFQMKIKLDSIRGRNTWLSISTPAFQLSGNCWQLHFDQFNADKKLYVSGMTIKGNELSVQSPELKVSTSDFGINDQQITGNNLVITKLSGDSLNTAIEQVIAFTDVPGLMQQRFSINQVKATGIHTRLFHHDSLQSMALQVQANLQINNIHYKDDMLHVGTMQFESGPFYFDQQKLVTRSQQENTGRQAEGRSIRSRMDSIFQRPQNIQADNLQKKLKKDPIEDTTAYVLQHTALASERGELVLSMTGIEADLSQKPARFHAKIKAMSFSDVAFTNTRVLAWFGSGEITNLIIHSDYLNNTRKLIEDNYPAIGITNLNVTLQTAKQRFGVNRLDYVPAQQFGRMTGVEIHPVISKEEYFSYHKFQIDYIQASIPSVEFLYPDIHRYLRDSVLRVSSITIVQPELTISRDKRYPFLNTAIKPLPTNALQKLKVKIQVDTIQMRHGRITYNERSRITGKEGTIVLGEVNARVRNIRNTEIKPLDSLFIRASARFMDSARVNLSVRESYADSLGNFVMTTQIAPFHTSILNPALVPLVSVEFKSGFADTLYMRAIGRESLSLGSMKFFYSDLKVDFLDKQDTTRNSLKNQLLQFAANNLVIRTNNIDRIGTVYYERDRNRSIVQYWIKMILSGVTTSVGAKSNKKVLKRYLRELNQKGLPPIEGNFDL